MNVLETGGIINTGYVLFLNGDRVSVDSYGSDISYILEDTDGTSVASITVLPIGSGDVGTEKEYNFKVQISPIHSTIPVGNYVLRVDSETLDIIARNIWVNVLSESAYSDLYNGILSTTGVTTGGNWTLQKALQVITAWTAGDWQVKPGDSTTQQLLDPDGGEVVLEQKISNTSPYRTITHLDVSE